MPSAFSKINLIKSFVEHKVGVSSFFLIKSFTDKKQIWKIPFPSPFLSLNPSKSANKPMICQVLKNGIMFAILIYLFKIILMQNRVNITIQYWWINNSWLLLTSMLKIVQLVCCILLVKHFKVTIEITLNHDALFPVLLAVGHLKHKFTSDKTESSDSNSAQISHLI